MPEDLAHSRGFHTGVASLPLPPVPQPWPQVSQDLLLQVWPAEQQHRHHLGTCERRRVSDPTSDSLNPNLHFQNVLRWLMSTLNKGQEALISGACRNVHQMAGLQQALAAEPQSGATSPSNSTLNGTRSLEPLPTNCGKHEWESEPRGEPYSMSGRLLRVSHESPLSGLTPGVSTFIV